MADTEINETRGTTTVTMRIVWILIGIFFLIMIISQIYIGLYNPLKTEVAQLYSTTGSVLFKGVYVRNEQPVVYTGGGVVAFTHTDGSKLAKNSVVAKIYANEDDLRYQKMIDELEEQEAVLKDAESLIGTDNSQLEAFSNQINERHALLLQNIENGDFKSAADMKNDYLNLQCKKKIVKGEETGYSEKIAALGTEISSLRARITKTPVDLTIGEAGYFVSSVDGYENVLNYDAIESLTEAEIEQIVKNPVSDTGKNQIGKVIDGYKWRMVGILDTQKTLSVFESAQVKMRVGSEAKTITATVLSVDKLEDGNSKIVFECDNLSAEFVESRVAQFRLLLDDYTGIRIPSEAIRFDEQNRQGVFIKSGVEVEFKLIDTILNESDYAIVRDTTADAGYLSLYDTIIVDGKDLYDGKIIS